MTTLLPPNVKVHLALGYIDMRKGIDGLAMLVQGVLQQDPPQRKMLYRRRGLSHSLSHTLSHPLSPSLSHVAYPSSRPEGPTVPRPREAHRRRFSEADKRRILEEAARPGASVSEVARQATVSPIAAEALRRIAELYAIETVIRGQTAASRQGMRQTRSLPLVRAMKSWLAGQLSNIPPRGSLADAIRYALNRWDALCRFLDDGRIELDTNTVERAIRPVTLGRKNHCSPDLTAAPSAGPPSAPSSPPPNLTTSSPLPTFRT